MKAQRFTRKTQTWRNEREKKRDKQIFAPQKVEKYKDSSSTRIKEKPLLGTMREEERQTNI